MSSRRPEHCGNWQTHVAATPNQNYGEWKNRSVRRQEEAGNVKKSIILIPLSLARSNVKQTKIYTTNQEVSSESLPTTHLHTFNFPWKGQMVSWACLLKTNVRTPVCMCLSVCLSVCICMLKLKQSKKKRKLEKNTRSHLSHESRRGHQNAGYKHRAGSAPSFYLSILLSGDSQSLSYKRNINWKTSRENDPLEAIDWKIWTENYQTKKYKPERMEWVSTRFFFFAMT